MPFPGEAPLAKYSHCRQDCCSVQWGQDLPEGTQTGSSTTARGVRKPVPLPSSISVNAGKETVAHWQLMAIKANSDTDRRSYEENA